MSEPQGVIRANISVPRELKARMEAADKGVNWSSVACSAFQVKLLELDSQKETKNMDEVIARLKAAGELEDREEYQAGRAAGEEWAGKQATPRQLRRLTKGMDDPGYGISGMLEVYVNGMNHGIQHGLCHAISGKEPGCGDAKMFWEVILGDDCAGQIDDLAFAQGFVEGALELWKKVGDQV